MKYSTYETNNCESILCRVKEIHNIKERNILIVDVYEFEEDKIIRENVVINKNQILEDTLIEKYIELQDKRDCLIEEEIKITNEIDDLRTEIFMPKGCTHDNY